MKLLFDENLSALLVGAFASEFPGSASVASVGLVSGTDLDVWVYARQHDFTVISKDDDFRHLSLVRGAPPKVIVVRIGNASTAKIETCIRAQLLRIKTFELSSNESLLIL